MHVKRYQAQTVQLALRAVREDLGPDALVVSTRMIAAPGPRGWFGARFVQVTAAADRTIVPETRHSAGESAPRAADADRAVQEPADQRLAPAGLEAPGEVARVRPRGRRLVPSVRSVRGTSLGMLAGLAAQDEGYAPIEVFVGPPGAGKTITIAKIAAQERARHGTRLGLVAADAFRVGAVEQLRLYAHILGSPLAVARTAYELQTALETATVPVLVDTAGRSAHDDTSLDLFRIVAGRPDVRVHLVVGADMPLTMLRAAVERFAPARPTRLVLTKMDEAESLEAVVALLREHPLPISYLGTGQRVPEDLQLATPRTLATWLGRSGGERGAQA
jgi:flagellar biosynthesis protein FlhF